jgi:hypothetical protein
MTGENTAITVQDIDAVVRLIDAVSARGAIRGEELTAVGAIRAKFAAVLQEEMAKQQTAVEAGTAPPALTEDAPTETVEDVDVSTVN